MSFFRINPITHQDNRPNSKRKGRLSLLRTSSIRSRISSTRFFSNKNASIIPDPDSNIFVTVDLEDTNTKRICVNNGVGTYIRYTDPNTTTYKPQCEWCSCLLYTDNVVQYNCTHTVCTKCTRLYRYDMKTIMCAICKTEIDWMAIQSVNAIHSIYSFKNCKLPHVVGEGEMSSSVTGKSFALLKL